MSKLFGDVSSMKFDMDEVFMGIEGMRRQAKRFQEAFKALKKPLREDQKEHAKEQSGPDGSWPARAPSTVARLTARPRGRTLKGRRRRKKKLRALLGRLPGALTVTANKTGVRAVSKVPWSGIHNDGGSGHKGRIPKRTFLWLSQRLIDLANKKLVDHVYTGWLGKFLGR